MNPSSRHQRDGYLIERPIEWCPGNIIGRRDSLQAKLQATQCLAEPVGKALSPHRISRQWQKALAPTLNRRQACIFFIHEPFPPTGCPLRLHQILYSTASVANRQVIDLSLGYNRRQGIKKGAGEHHDEHTGNRTYYSYSS